MARIICEAIIKDANEMERVTSELKALRVRFQVYRDYVYVDCYCNELGKARDIKDIFYGVPLAQVRQIG